MPWKEDAVRRRDSGGERRGRIRYPVTTTVQKECLTSANLGRKCRGTHRGSRLAGRVRNIQGSGGGRTDGRETGRERIIGQQERSRRSWSEQVSFAEAWRPYPDDEVGTAGRAVAQRGEAPRRTDGRFQLETLSAGLAISQASRD